MQVDINADMGESFGMYKLGNDAGVMEYITSANVACGYHAGDSSVMHETVLLAKEHNVAVGAHPGLPDLQGFGRRPLALTPREVYDETMYQAGALLGFCKAVGVRLHHLKPHGSLYGMAHRDKKVAQAICQVIKDLDSGLYLYVMKKGVISDVAGRMGIKTVYELYSDLDYDEDGNLVITREHAHLDAGRLADRVLGMVRDHRVKTLRGEDIGIEGDSVCVHSDTPGAIDNLIAVRRVLENAGYHAAAP